ncbi:hypothetical protein REPUB_Repub02eG0009100 [Reevesia pubescens]
MMITAMETSISDYWHCVQLQPEENYLIRVAGADAVLNVLLLISYVSIKSVKRDCKHNEMKHETPF